MNEAVDKSLKEFPSSKIVVTGHSLGGALSEVCGLEMFKRYGNKLSEVHNFGCPRLGNA